MLIATLRSRDSRGVVLQQSLVTCDLEELDFESKLLGPVGEQFRATHPANQRDRVAVVELLMLWQEDSGDGFLHSYVLSFKPYDSHGRVHAAVPLRAQLSHVDYQVVVDAQSRVVEDLNRAARAAEQPSDFVTALPLTIAKLA
mgnify:CR=1 FL=1